MSHRELLPNALTLAATIDYKEDTFVTNHDDSQAPDYEAIISRESVVELARRDDVLGTFAKELLAARDEEALFREGTRRYISKVDQKKRRFAIAALASAFQADRQQLKRLLRFWGIVNETD